MTYSISIIIVNYNGKKWLAKCLDSLFRQSFGDFEIILVDNDSSDDSVGFLEENYYDSRLRIIKNPKNLGFASGNNLGIDNAQGKYILLLNNDTWVEDDFLSRIIDFYEKNDYDVVAPWEKGYDSNCEFREHYSLIDPFGHPISMNKKNIRQDFYLSGVCVFFSKELYRETGGMDNDFFMYFEETDWFWRLILANKKFARAKDVFVYHFGYGSTGGGKKYLNFLWRNQNNLQMLLKNYSWLNLFWVLPIYFLINVFEIFFLLLVFRPDMAFSYIQGWMFNINNFQRTIAKRLFVQKIRIVSDREVLRRMYHGSSKLVNWPKFFLRKKHDKSLLS
jgi:GT2 family glycosyltransferase